GEVVGTYHRGVGWKRRIAPADVFLERIARPLAREPLLRRVHPDDELVVGTAREGIDHRVEPRPDRGEGDVAADHRGVPGEVGEERDQTSAPSLDSMVAERPELVEGSTAPTSLEVLVELRILGRCERAVFARPLGGEVVEAR